jgi:hypothetical protein
MFWLYLKNALQEKQQRLHSFYKKYIDKIDLLSVVRLRHRPETPPKRPIAVHRRQRM